MTTVAGGTRYDHLAAVVAALVPRWRLGTGHARIGGVFELVCREALDLAPDHHPVRASRLNADGTPVQFALTAGPHPPGLQFLADPGPPDASAGDRRAIARRLTDQLTRLVDAGPAGARILSLFDEFAPADDRRLLADGAGAAWVGAGFAPGRGPVMKVYLNARWGGAAEQRARIAAFAARFAIPDRAWLAVDALAADLQPLGVAVTAGRGALRGRVYLAGFGLPFDRYERLAARLGDSGLERRVRRFGEVLLGADKAHPTRSVVCSVGLRAGRLTDPKVELCAHCAFDDDAQARRRCLRWLRSDGADPAGYLDLTEALGGCGGRGLHAYVGVSGPERAGSATFYFNPAAAAPHPAALVIPAADSRPVGDRGRAADSGRAARSHAGGGRAARSHAGGGRAARSHAEGDGNPAADWHLPADPDRAAGRV